MDKFPLDEKSKSWHNTRINFDGFDDIICDDKSVAKYFWNIEMIMKGYSPKEIEDIERQKPDIFC